MSPNATKALLVVSAVVIAVNGFSVVSEARAAKARTQELVSLRLDVAKIAVEMERLRSLVAAYEKEKAAATAASGATATATPATK
jgi:hypothetical protein